MMAAFKVGQCFLFSVLWRSLCTTGVLFFGFWLFFLQCLEAFTEEAFGLEIVTLSPWDLTVMLTGIFISEVEQLFICWNSCSLSVVCWVVSLILNIQGLKETSPISCYVLKLSPQGFHWSFKIPSASNFKIFVCSNLSFFFFLLWLLDVRSWLKKAFPTLRTQIKSSHVFLWYLYLLYTIYIYMIFIF